MWDPVPWPGIEPRPPALGAWSLSHWTTSEVPSLYFCLWGHICYLYVVCVRFSACSGWLRHLWIMERACDDTRFGFLLNWVLPWWNISWDFPFAMSENLLPFFFLALGNCREGNGNPRQCSCLENPRDGGAWWAAVSGVALIRPRLKQLSSSSRELWSWETILHWIVCYLTTPAVIIRALFHLIVLLRYKKGDFLTLHSHYIL